MQSRNPNIQEPETFQNFSTMFSEIFNKKLFLFIALLIFIISSIMASISWLVAKIFAKSQFIPLVGIVLIFVFFFLWLSMLFIIFLWQSTEIEYNVFVRIINLFFLMSVLSTYLAIIIENKALIFANALGYIIDFLSLKPYNTHYVALVFYSSLIPVIEETIKILPILILVQSLLKIKSGSSTHYLPLVPSLKTFIFLGGISGGFFDLIEQFFILSRINSSEIFPILIFRRSIFPLHMMCSMLAALSVGLFYYFRANRYNKILKRKRKNHKMRVILNIFPITFAIAFHGLWNYLSQTGQSYVLLYLGYFSYFVSFVFILIFFHHTQHCPNCFGEHHESFCPESVPNEVESFNIILKNQKKINFLQDSDLLPCPNCFLNQYNGDYCLHCWSFPKLECKNCHQVLPAFARVCWSCGSEVESIYDKMSSNSPSVIASVSIGVTRLFSGLITTLFIISFSSFSNDLSSLSYTLFFLIITASFITVTIWSLSEKNRTKAVLCSISITSAMLLMLAIYALYYLIFVFLLLYFGLHIVFSTLILFCIIAILVVVLIYFKNMIKEIRLIV